MALFEPGKVLKTDLGAPITIVKHLGGGGQGDVYSVEYQGKQKALKWYKQGALREPEAFYKNLSHNISKGSPDAAFLWPEAITEKTEGSFGYIMDLRPEGYYELSKIMASEALNFSSFRMATEACIEIVSAFGALHDIGYVFQYFEMGNLLVNPTEGRVIICFSENITPEGIDRGVIGNPRFMAPENITGRGVLPTIESDLHVLAVILFLILLAGHPLEGKRWLVPCMNDAYAEKLYGTAPVFICDPDDKSNGPVKNIHVNVIRRWGFMPQYIKDAFLKAFSQEALKNPDRRLREFDWMNVLVRFRSDIVKCSCGNEVFVLDAASTKCDACGKMVNIKHKITLPGYSIAVSKGTSVYKCQLGLNDRKASLEYIGCVVQARDDPERMGFRNLTGRIIGVTTPSGKNKELKPSEIVPIRNGITLSVFDKSIEFHDVVL